MKLYYLFYPLWLENNVSFFLSLYILHLKLKTHEKVLWNSMINVMKVCKNVCGWTPWYNNMNAVISNFDMFFFSIDLIVLKASDSVLTNYFLSITVSEINFTEIKGQKVPIYKIWTLYFSSNFTAYFTKYSFYWIICESIKKI